jgi:hypothetical protein
MFQFNCQQGFLVFFGWGGGAFRGTIGGETGMERHFVCHLSYCACSPLIAWLLNAYPLKHTFSL